ncbi:MAG: hypothetical protein KatS3mg119_0007 [Rhodothalassiaceae bacterium]|nr:MAG: hypothetical protein KatS3mg119_0007 [Rhodothalassiaceae bacterium]
MAPPGSPTTPSAVGVDDDLGRGRHLSSGPRRHASAAPSRVRSGRPTFGELFQPLSQTFDADCRPLLGRRIWTANPDLGREPPSRTVRRWAFPPLGDLRRSQSERVECRLLWRQPERAGGAGALLDGGHDRDAALGALACRSSRRLLQDQDQGRDCDASCPRRRLVAQRCVDGPTLDPTFCSLIKRAHGRGRSNAFEIIGVPARRFAQCGGPLHPRCGFRCASTARPSMILSGASGVTSASACAALGSTA